MSTLLWAVMVALLIFLNSPVRGQSVDTQTFTSKDGSFSFEYPIEWSIEAIQNAWGEDDHLAVTNYSSNENLFDPESIILQMTFPAKLVEMGLTSAQTPREMVEKDVAEVDAAAPLMSIFGGGPVIEINPTFLPPETPTPQPTNTPRSPVNIPPITEFTVNGRSAAYGYAIIQMAEIDASQLIVVVDLGEGYWVQLSTGSIQGGLSTIQKNEAAVLQIAQSLRFTPLPPAASGNPDLPLLYAGPVGIWHRGSVTFSYLEEWYISEMFGVVFSNKPGNLLNVKPVPGQFIAALDGVSETRTLVDPSEAGNSCNIPKPNWTARAIAAQIMSNIFPGQLKALTAAGISITQPEIVVINGIEIVFYRQYEKETEALIMLVDLGGGNIMALTANTVRGEMVYFEDQLFQVAGTLEYTPRIYESCLQPTPQN